MHLEHKYKTDWEGIESAIIEARVLHNTIKNIYVSIKNLETKIKKDIDDKGDPEIYKKELAELEKSKEFLEKEAYGESWKHILEAGKTYNQTKEKIFEKEQREKGFKKYNGKWMTPSEISKLKEEERKRKEMELGISNNFAYMDPYEFEEFIAKLFRAMGYSAHKTQSTGDYGADVIAEKGEEKIVVQVKKYHDGNPVNAIDIQKTLGSAVFYGASKVILVTTSRFTRQAVHMIEENKGRIKIELWDKDTLHSMIRQYMIE